MKRRADDAIGGLSCLLLLDILYEQGVCYLTDAPLPGNSHAPLHVNTLRCCFSPIQVGASTATGLLVISRIMEDYCFDSPS